VREEDPGVHPSGHHVLGQGEGTPQQARVLLRLHDRHGVESVLEGEPQPVPSRLECLRQLHQPRDALLRRLSTPLDVQEGREPRGEDEERLDAGPRQLTGHVERDRRRHSEGGEARVEGGGGVQAAITEGHANVEREGDLLRLEHVRARDAGEAMLEEGVGAELGAAQRARHPHRALQPLLEVGACRRSIRAQGCGAHGERVAGGHTKLFQPHHGPLQCAEQLPERGVLPLGHVPERGDDALEHPSGVPAGLREARGEGQHFEEGALGPFERRGGGPDAVLLDPRAIDSPILQREEQLGQRTEEGREVLGPLARDDHEGGDGEVERGPQVQPPGVQCLHEAGERGEPGLHGLTQPVRVLGEGRRPVLQGRGGIDAGLLEPGGQGLERSVHVSVILPRI
jgi:hypothetical protein